MLVRFWDSDVSAVTERCLPSDFLGQATAVDMLVHLKNEFNKFYHSLFTVAVYFKLNLKV